MEPVKLPVDPKAWRQEPWERLINKICADLRPVPIRKAPPRETEDREGRDRREAA